MGQRTTIDFVRGDMSGLQAVKQELAEAAEMAAKIQKTIGETGGAALSPQQRMEHERLRNERTALQTEQIRARQELLKDSEASSGRRRGEQQEARSQAREGQRVLGAGQLGAGAISAAVSSNPAGVLGGLGSLINNPWATAAFAMSGAALFAGKAGLNEGYEAATNFNAAVAEGAPFAMRRGDVAPDIGVAVRYGYGPIAAQRRLAAYARASGLEDRGLGMESILQLERSRGIGADVSGSVSSIFAAGRGGVGGGSPDQVAQFFRAAIGEGIEQGLKNAHMPEYLQAVATATTRFASRGLDVDPRDILGVQSGLRSAGGSLFAGTRGIAATAAFQDHGMGIADRMAGVLPKEMLDQVMMARYLRRTGGDLGAAIALAEKESANGAIVDETANAARSMMGGSRLGAVALRGMGGIGMDQASAIYGRYEGRGSSSEAPLYDDTVMLQATTRALSARAKLEERDIRYGTKHWKTVQDMEEKSQKAKQPLGDAAASVWDAVDMGYLNGVVDRIIGLDINGAVDQMLAPAKEGASWWLRDTVPRAPVGNPFMPRSVLPARPDVEPIIPSGMQKVDAGARDFNRAVARFVGAVERLVGGERTIPDDMTV